MQARTGYNSFVGPSHSPSGDPPGMRWFLSLLVSFSLFSAIFPQGSNDPKKNSSAAAKPSFSREVMPFLQKHCLQCHGGKKPKAGLSFEVFKDDAAADKQREIWEKVSLSLRSGEMPPSGRPKPLAQEIDFIVGWLDKNLARANCSGPRDPGRVTLRRLNRAEYNNTLRDLLGINFKPADDFPSDDVGYGFDNIGDVLTLSPLLMEKYLAAAEKAVELALQNPVHREMLMAKPPGKPKRREAARFILRNFGNKAYRRPITDKEIERLMSIVDLAEQNGQADKGIPLAFQAMLCSPHFLFRVEKDRGNKPGDIPPSSEYELASRLSYFLGSTMPDDELVRLAEQGKLRKELELQVRRMLKDGKIRALTENFAGQWLQLRSLAQAQPDPKLFPTFNAALRDAMLQETEL